MASKMPKVVITIAEVEDGAYIVTADDDVAVTKYTTTNPRGVIMDILRTFKIQARRGRPLGSKNKKGVDNVEEAAQYDPSPRIECSP